MKRYTYHRDHGCWYDQDGNIPPMDGVLVQEVEPDTGPLVLAEAYYTVSRHLQENAERLADTAEMLGTAADKICEENMRKKQPSERSETP